MRDAIGTTNTTINIVANASYGAAFNLEYTCLVLRDEKYLCILKSR